MITGFYTSVDRNKNQIMYRGYDADGLKTYNKFKFRPVLYVETKELNTKWKSLEGKPLEPVRFESMSDCRAFVKQYEDIPSFKIHGNDKHIPAFIQAEFPNEIKYDDKKIDVAILDIECKFSHGFPEPSIADQELTLIGLKSTRLDRYIQWGTCPIDKSKSVLSNIKVEYRFFPTEVLMLEDFVEWWSDIQNCPDVITGWNTRFFDIPYLVNRISRVLNHDIVKRLSPWGIIEQRTQIIKNKEQMFFNICGIQQLDYMELFKKFTVNTYGAQESYSLDFISDVVLGEGKISYSDEYGSLSELYEQNFNLYADYNIVDLQLIEKIDAKIGLLSLVFTLAYFGGVNYSDTLGTVAIWDSIIFRRLASENIAVPANKMSFKTEYAGGYVKEVDKGRHEWVMTFDLNSLYPNLIIQYNMSPETIVPHSKVYGMSPEKMLSNTDRNHRWSPNENLSIAPNGACFSNDKEGFLPKIVEEIYNQRVSIKKTLNKAETELEEMKKLLATF